MTMPHPIPRRGGRPGWPVLLLLAYMSAAAKSASGQAMPSASPAPAVQASSAAPTVGFRFPTVGGSLNYAITASESITKGFFQNSGTDAYTNIGGNLAYVSKSERHPFSAIYSGGYLISTTPQPSAFYQSLSFSQVLSTKRWNIVASDSVNYLPQGPTLGLSGVAGLGDLNTPPPQSIGSSGIGILTDYGPQVSNNFSLSVSRQLTAHVSAQGSGAISTLRFVGDNSQVGLNSTGYTGSGGLSYRLDARSSLNGNYSYTHFSYGGSAFSFDTQSGSLGYGRTLNRSLSVNLYAGPQYSVSTQAGLKYSNVGVTAGAALSYALRLATLNLTYYHGITNGSGVLAGAVSDGLSFSASRQFARVWSTSASASYSHQTSLPGLNPSTFASNAIAAGGQVNRRITRTLSGFASYNVVKQSASGPVPVNAFSGTYQVVGAGVTYSPSSIRLGR